jgi:hypothetical protein
MLTLSQVTGELPQIINGTRVVSVDLRAECGQIFEFVEYVPVAADPVRR